MATQPTVEAGAQTHRGMRRETNEDAMLAEYPVFVVADGMGGHEAGDRASATAIATLARLTEAKRRSLTVADVDAAIDAARDAVASVASHTARGAGCTLTGAILVEHEGQNRWYVINVGDSRVYQLVGEDLQQLTDDHSLYAELLAGGAAEAAEQTPRNVITRALGSSDSRHDGWLLTPRKGTRLLICSDGLSGEVDDEELRAILTIGGRPQAVADELVRRACENGGRDNVTAIVIDTVTDGSETRSAAADEGESDDTIDIWDTLEKTKPGHS